MSTLSAAAAFDGGGALATYYADDPRQAEYQWETSQPLASTTNSSATTVTNGQTLPLSLKSKEVRLATSLERFPRRQKRGHNFCRCGCDMRRAVMVVNGINLSLLILLSIILDDDNSNGATRVSIEDAVLIFGCALGLIGAVQYNTSLTAVASVVYAFFFLHAIFFEKNITNLLACGISLYPHTFFIREVQLGIMGPETYRNEAMWCRHSFCWCCCLSQKSRINPGDEEGAVA